MISEFFKRYLRITEGIMYIIINEFVGSDFKDTGDLKLHKIKKQNKLHIAHIHLYIVHALWESVDPFWHK